MIRVFVSGCYDIIHAGHVQFFREARALGDHLTVCFASADVLWLHKQRRSSLPDDHKRAVLAALDPIDEVVVGEGLEEGIDFRDHFLRLRPQILAVTEDDKWAPLKRALCAEVGARYVVLPKTPPKFSPVSTTQIVKFIRAPEAAPLRVDFAGGWLDVPRFARKGAFVVNCAISPTVSLRDWPYNRNAGLGGSGAWALLNGKDGVASELGLGVGWQDPAIISETGLCVWRSGPRPELELKHNGAFLRGRLALFWTGTDHDTPDLANRPGILMRSSAPEPPRVTPCGAATSTRWRKPSASPMRCSWAKACSPCRPTSRGAGVQVFRRRVRRLRGVPVRRRGAAGRRLRAQGLPPDRALSRDPLTPPVHGSFFSESAAGVNFGSSLSAAS
jgi:cytidyltransferase-like protein